MMTVGRTMVSVRVSSLFATITSFTVVGSSLCPSRTKVSRPGVVWLSSVIGVISEKSLGGRFRSALCPIWAKVSRSLVVWLSSVIGLIGGTGVGGHSKCVGVSGVVGSVVVAGMKLCITSMTSRIVTALSGDK
jgi:hypothetical protein